MPVRTFHKHFGPDALSGGKLNEANQRHIEGGSGRASVVGILKLGMGFIAGWKAPFNQFRLGLVIG
jgi:hypothetical protein